ncbi:NAD(P)-dependent dehydrogenase (short-subunit alcohol dehydrogenase family) [Actinophytocola oryzae]|uniref:NAD(P)-dependent dehydrogenase (Short-subunit alcohol dehydrogenase family) n=1 Tax=Actinophytocola oryzae TaxID=502181 RepID=A0A4R7VVH5_9PSEU|nr:NAD(P)-dependent dehydrogenase (short-subunit alcohol dehydrogenase family) [Actinophytocola oryzae]
MTAGRLLIEEGHEVVLHARDTSRDPGIAEVVVGDFSSMAEVRSVAAQADALGPFDAVIHNVAVGYQERRRTVTEDGFALVFAVNVLAPYLLTASMARPSRLVYLSSGMHRGGDPSLVDLQWERRRWSGSQAYSDSKFWDVVLAFALARRWPATPSNAVDPGWVATRMGGAGAPDDLTQGSVTQVRLALGQLGGTGGYLYHLTRVNSHPAASDPALQDAFLARCAELTGTPIE